MKRSWAADKGHLTEALSQLGHDANITPDYDVIPLAPPPKRSPLWLLIFPEGTIASDEERVKSVKYAAREDTVSAATCMADIRMTLSPCCIPDLRDSCSVFELCSPIFRT